MERHRLELRYNEALACEVVTVVRDHHDTMPGPDRDRPGFDRIRVRAFDGREAVIDVWSQTGQAIRATPGPIELVDGGDFLTWRPAPPEATARARDAVASGTASAALRPVEDKPGPAGALPAPARAHEPAPASASSVDDAERKRNEQ